MIDQDTNDDLKRAGELVHDEIAVAMGFNICPATAAHLQRVLVSFNAYMAATNNGEIKNG